MSNESNKIDRFLAGVARMREFTGPDAIARFFGDLGLRGQCGDRADCVTARFLKECIGDPDADVSVSPIGITYVWDEDEEKPHSDRTLVEASVKFESAFSDFLENFDMGAYPDLVEVKPPTPVDPEPVVLLAEETTAAREILEPEPVKAVFCKVDESAPELAEA